MPLFESEERCGRIRMWRVPSRTSVDDAHILGATDRAVSGEAVRNARTHQGAKFQCLYLHHFPNDMEGAIVRGDPATNETRHHSPPTLWEATSAVPAQRLYRISALVEMGHSTLCAPPAPFSSKVSGASCTSSSRDPMDRLRGMLPSMLPVLVGESNVVICI